MLLFFDVSGGEIFVILLFVLIFFGSKKIPEMARGLGRGLREIKDASDSIKREIQQEGNKVRDELNQIGRSIPDLEKEATSNNEESNTSSRAESTDNSGTTTAEAKTEPEEKPGNETVKPHPGSTPRNQ